MWRDVRGFIRRLLIAIILLKRVTQYDGIVQVIANSMWCWEMSHPLYETALRWMMLLSKMGPRLVSVGGSNPSGIDMGENMEGMFRRTMGRNESNEKILKILKGAK